MSGYYTYLISSLPTLYFGAKPPFSMERLLSVCEGLISDEDLEAVKDSVYNGLKENPDAPPAIKRWNSFDIALRNELVRIRAARKHLDGSRFLREDGFADQWISHIAIGAYRNQSILDAERMLDQDRWKFLDELSTGHYFDLELFVIYALKLSILERWERIRAADTEKLLEEALTT